MRLTTCVQQFFDLYHLRIKGSSQQTIKGDSNIKIHKKTNCFINNNKALDCERKLLYDQHETP